MTKRERVTAAIRGEEVDGIPSSFSLHFPKDANSGDAGIEAHLAFFRDSDTDIIKIMNENLVPGSADIVNAADYSAYTKHVDVKQPFMKTQLEYTKKILAKADPDAFSVGTLHGICASGIHPFEGPKHLTYGQARMMLKRLLQENEQLMLSSMARITEGMCGLAKGYIEAGCDGVYFAALGGEKRFFTDEEFERWIKPFDIQIMQAVRDAGGYVFLHICKDGLNMDRYKDYWQYADVVNWGVYETHYSLEEGRNLFHGRTVMGGLANRTGVLAEGTKEEAVKEALQVISSYGRKNFILGADCTLATDQNMEVLRAVVDAAHNA